MIIVLDGPDGTGKTTLAKAMCKQLHADYLHLTYRWKDRIFDYHTAAIRYAARKMCPVVIDRWWPSEAVYAKAFRGGSTWPLQGRLCQRVARKFAVVYVYCLPDSVQSAVKQHTQLAQIREEMYDDITDVADLYLKLWHGEHTHPDTGQYIDQLIRTGGVHEQADHFCYTISTWGHIINLFIERIAAAAVTWREAQFQPALQYNNWNLLGHMEKAEYLIVGEQVNPKFRRLFWPFYDYGNSSLLLTQALHKLNLDESRFMWANALNHDGTKNTLIHTLLEQKPLKVITLGAIARKLLENERVFAALPHPAWVKRFGRVDMVEVFKHAINQ